MGNYSFMGSRVSILQDERKQMDWRWESVDSLMLQAFNDSKNEIGENKIFLKIQGDVKA